LQSLPSNVRHFHPPKKHGAPCRDAPPHTLDTRALSIVELGSHLSSLNIYIEPETRATAERDGRGLWPGRVYPPAGWFAKQIRVEIERRRKWLLSLAKTTGEELHPPPGRRLWRQPSPWPNWRANENEDPSNSSWN
jgi:hypothetical protein